MAPLTNRPFVVPHGAGFQQQIDNYVTQNTHINLTDAQSWRLYEYLNNHTANGHFLISKDTTSWQSLRYKMPDGNWGINYTGAQAYWSEHSLNLMHRWLEDHSDELEND